MRTDWKSLLVLLIGLAVSECKNVQIVERQSALEGSPVIVTVRGIGRNKFLNELNLQFPTLPSCGINGTALKCCIQAYSGICVKLNISTSDMKAVLEVTHNGTVVVNPAVRFGKFCSAVPPPILYVCLEIFSIDIRPSEKYINVCFDVQVLGLFMYNFGCIRYNNGTFDRNNDYSPPESSGIPIDFNVIKEIPVFNQYFPNIKN